MSTTRWATSTRFDVLGLEDGGAGVEPADLQEVDQQRLEPVELGLQQLGGPRGGRLEAVPGVVQHVAGHPHRGQRGAQLVRHVRDEPPLHPAQLLELADLALQVAGHLVERRGEAGEVVLALHPHPLLQVAGGEPFGDPPGQPDRGDDLAGHQPGHPGHQHQQEDGRGEQRPGHEGQRLLLLVEREEVVERVGLTVRRQPHRGPDHDPRLRPDGPVGPGRGADAGVGPGGRRDRLVEVLLQRRGDARGLEARREQRAAVGDPAAVVPDRAGEDDAEPAGAARAG